MKNLAILSTLSLALGVPAWAVNDVVPSTSNSGTVVTEPGSNVSTTRDGVSTRSTMTPPANRNRPGLTDSTGWPMYDNSTTNSVPSNSWTNMNRNPYGSTNGMGSNANGTTGISGADASGANNPGMSPNSSPTGNSRASDSSGLDR